MPSINVKDYNPSEEKFMTAGVITKEQRAKQRFWNKYFLFNSKNGYFREGLKFGWYLATPFLFAFFASQQSTRDAVFRREKEAYDKAWEGVDVEAVREKVREQQRPMGIMGAPGTHVEYNGYTEEYLLARIKRKQKE
ncbi:hypothetical protein AKO1_002706 [Acrasis kona]|uniref:Uncharacterized protein n=1 Tax=Acrasis kona TaxID=1008807 RepID=A0AAW2ZP43_9EUKA